MASRVVHTMIVPLLASAGVCSAACGSTPPPSAPAALGTAAEANDCEPAPLRASCCRVFHSRSTVEDARKVAHMSDRAIELLGQELGAPVPELLRTVSIDIHLMPRPTATVHAGTASMRTQGDTDGYRADLDLLAPSAWEPGLRNSVGAPLDDDYLLRTLIHEYASIALDLLSRHEPGGLRFHRAPRWFVQGYEEHLAITLGPDALGRRYLDTYLARIAQDPSRVGPTFDVEDDYSDGGAILHFLHQEFGAARVRAILTGHSDQFWAAVRDALGEDRETLFSHWQEWNRRRVRDREPSP